MAGPEPFNGRTVDTEEEYEYEYDDNETEIFYVDLDLSSINGVIKPRIQARKKLIPNSTKIVGTTTDPVASTPTPTPTLAGTETGDVTPRPPSGDTRPDTPVSTKARVLEAPESGSEIQILELESYNPVVSYQNEVYSCTWSDMIGTNMFFSEHDEETTPDPLHATEDYDLLGTSRIKLVGRKARLTNKPGRSGGYKNTVNDVEEEKELRPGKGFGSLRSSNPVVNRERKKQAKFLENLMDAKRAQGQTDNVRTVYNPSRVPRGEVKASFTMQGGQASSQEIDELNRKVVRGDAAALRRLQMIYSEQDEQQADDGVPQATAPTPRSAWHGSIDTENANLDQTNNAQNT